MQEYYNRRAREYEAIYATDDPTRRAELAAIAAQVASLLAGRRVFEVACGTGYWTTIIAKAASNVTATDASKEMLEIASSKALPPNRVTFLTADAYDLASVPGKFDAALANFWLSHVPRARIDEFLTGLGARLEPGSVVFMADNMYMPGVGGELVSTPGHPDTFKLRTLADGSQHLVLKNYYDEGQLRTLLNSYASDLRVHMGTAYWWCSYSKP